MAKVNDNGIVRDLRPEEIAEMERMAAEFPAPEPTYDERLAVLEAENKHLKEALDLLLSGVTTDE